MLNLTPPLKDGLRTWDIKPLLREEGVELAGPRLDLKKDHGVADRYAAGNRGAQRVSDEKRRSNDRDSHRGDRAH
jgi:hypothetical protein